MSGCLSKKSLLALVVVCFIYIAMGANRAKCYPANDSDWIALLKDGAILQDPNDDANGARDIVCDATHAPVFFANDGTNIYFRLRLDVDPRKNNGEYLPYGWGVEFDSDNIDNTYEWLIIVNGKNPAGVLLQQNTEQKEINDPSDRCEEEKRNYTPVTSYSRVVAADTSFNGDQDYFIDFFMPYSDLKSDSGLTDNSPIRIIAGSSADSHSLREQGQSGDLVYSSGSGTLSEGFSDYVTLTGQIATTGTVTFVAAADGSGDVTQINAGDTIYTRVDDNDRNLDPNAADTITVSLTSTIAGDSETVTLTETGNNTGIFVASIASESAAATASDGKMQVSSTDIVTATYTDAVDADGNTDQSRTDTIAVGSANSAPVAADDTTTTLEDTSVTVSVLTNDTDPEDDSLIITAITQPGNGVSVDNGDGTVTYTPAANFNGSDSFTYTIFDGNGGTDTANVTVTVTAVNDDPDAVYDTPTTPEDTPVTVSVLTNDTDPEDDSLSITAITQPGNGVSVVNGDGTITYTPAADFNGSDSFTYTISDGNGGTGTATVTVTVTAAKSNLSIIKSVDQPAPITGDTVVYTITVTNGGPDAATNVKIGDTLPPGVTYVSDDGNGSYASNVWTAGSIANGASKILKITCTVSAASGVTVTNTANVSSLGQIDPASGNDSASVPLTVAASSDLSISKSIDEPAPINGSTVVYTITVTNSGPDDATNIVITDELPAGVTYASDDGDYANSDWSISNLANGASKTLKITCIVTGDLGDTITNTASVSSLDQPDPDSGNDSDDAPLTVEASSNLSISKSVDEPATITGDTVFYTITVTNGGPDDATSIVIADVLPTGVTYVSDDGNGDYDGDMWSVSSLANGATATLNITCTVSAVSGTTVTNTASVSSLDQTDPVSDNDSASVPLTVEVSSDLSVSKSVDRSVAINGSTVIYTIAVTNNGPDDATNIVIIDVLPAGVTYVSDDGDYDSDVWSIPSLANDATATLNITVTVTGDAGDAITNTASITSLDQPDHVNDNDSDSAPFTVGTSPDPSVIKSVGESPRITGATLVYTIQYANTGNAAAAQVRITDQVPADTNFISATDGGAEDQGTVTWAIGDLAVGGTGSVQLSVVVNSDAPVDSVISNTASISCQEVSDAVSNRVDVVVEPTIPVGITLVSDRDTILGDGQHASKLTVIVADAAGNPIDGVMVAFTTTRGTFSNGLQELSALTEDGKVVTYLTADLVSNVPVEAFVTTTAGTPETGIVESTTRFIFAPGAIAGFLVSNESGPIVGAEVLIVDEAGNIVGTDISDEDGYYIVGIPAIGVYTVVVKVKDDLGTEVSFTEEVDVSELSGSVFEPKNAISGTVIGSVLPDVTLYLLNDEGDPVLDDNGDQIVVVTDLQGKYAIQGLTVGTYTADIRLDRPGYYRHGSVIINIREKGEFIVDANVYAKRLGFVYDAWTNQRIKDTTVSLFDANTGALVSLPPYLEETQSNADITDSLGNYSFFVRPGEYFITVTAPNYTDFKSEKIIVGADKDVVNPNIPFVETPIVTFTNTADRTTVVQGDLITYTLTYQNNGGNSANTIITAPIPDNTAFISASDNGVKAGGVVTWALQTLGSQETGSVQLTVEVLSVESDIVVENTATIDGDSIDSVSDIASVNIIAVTIYENVSDAVRIDRFDVGFYRCGAETYMRCTWLNTGDRQFLKPLHMVIENITPDTVIVTNPDGFTASGKPYFDYSDLVGDGKLGPKELSESKQLTFRNWDNVRFEFDVSCWAVLSGGNAGGGVAPSKQQVQRIRIVIPVISSLAQNYPNPFNPETWIPYELAEAGKVSIRIYNVQGRLVRMLNLGHREVDQYFAKEKAVYWNGRNEAGESVASGVYFYTIQVGEFTATKKMILAQ